MRSIAFVYVVAATLALAGCGKSDKVGEGATADTVEMPAEEAMSDTTGMPSDTAPDAMADGPTADGATEMAPTTSPAM